MKSVLISIQPKWVEKIASGKNTIEVRKTAPKEVPFKCYIYMTQGTYKDLGLYSEGVYQNRMKVIGEFICDKVYDILPHNDGYKTNQYEMGWKYGEADCCLSFDELYSYLGDRNGYGWHITDLKIYDKTKELSEFCIPCKTNCENCKKPLFYDCWEEKGRVKLVTRPPQSYMFVEEI